MIRDEELRTLIVENPEVANFVKVLTQFIAQEGRGVPRDETTAVWMLGRQSVLMLLTDILNNVNKR